MKDIFRAYDIRGIFPAQLSIELAKQCGNALGKNLAAKGEKCVFTGRDARLSGEALHQAVVQGLNDAGIYSIDLGVVTSPMCYYACHSTDETNSCIMVTASHNPQEYNGLKVVIDGQALMETHIKELYYEVKSGHYFTANSESDKACAASARNRNTDIYPSYKNAVVAMAALLPHEKSFSSEPLPVIFDAGNSIGGRYAPDLLEACGAKVTPMYCEVDGTFPNHHADPANLSTLQDLIQQVTQTGHVGMAIDGDGDRLGVVDEKARIVNPEHLIMLFIQDIVEQIKQDNNASHTAKSNSTTLEADIIFDVKCSPKVGLFARDNGVAPILSRTGHSYMKQKMRSPTAIFAGEMSGHFFFKHRWYGFDDGILAAALLVRILRKQQYRLCDLVDTLPQEHLSQEYNWPIPRAIGEHMLAILIQPELLQHFFDGGRHIGIDGVRVEYPNKWGVVRLSNTSEKLVMRFGGDSHEDLEHIRTQFQDALTACATKIGQDAPVFDAL